MAGNPVMRTLLCLLFIIVVWTPGSGCSPEKNSEKNTGPAAAGTEERQQTTRSALRSPKTGPEKSLPQGTASETDQGKNVPAAESATARSTGQTPPAEIVILSGLWKTHTRGPVRLSHEKHIRIHKINCDECHHIFKDGKNTWKKGMAVAKCETCHNEPTIKGVKKLPPDLQKKNLKLAFHNTCLGCHRQVKGKTPETKAPVKCAQCHAKKS